jgi:enoyl-CoA hydratase
VNQILLEVNDNVAVVTINRAESLNAFNYETLQELQLKVEEIRINPDIRAVVFIGSGEKAFSVGADLKERKNLTDAQVKRNLYKINEVFTSIDQLPQPTIAAINGFAFGGGMELALACDFRIAAEEAVMGLTETRLAIIPGAGGTQRLPRLIGEAKALELILTARRFTAEEGVSYGVVTKVVNQKELLTECLAFLAPILANGPIAVQQAKFAIKNGMNADLATGLQIERKAYEVTLPTKDRVEALQAFAEKRKPVFRGE